MPFVCGVSTNVLLKQSVDEVCEAWADKLNNEVGENGDFLRDCPLYGVKVEEYEELELQIPCCCCCEKYYEVIEDGIHTLVQC